MKTIWKLAIPSVLAVLIIGGVVAATNYNQLAATAWSPVYYTNPVLGQYTFVTDSGSVLVNGHAYSYAVLDMSRITKGDHFVFLPALNSQIGQQGVILNATITFLGQSHSAAASEISLRIHLPFNNQTVTATAEGSPTANAVGTANVIGTSGSNIFIKAKWLDEQTVKLFCYIGAADTPLAP